MLPYTVINWLVFCSCLHLEFMNCNNYYPLDNSRNCDNGQQVERMYDNHHFYPISEMHGPQPDRYYAKILLSVIPAIGSETIIVLSESQELNGKNQCYEFVFGGTNIFAGIRRKSRVREMCHFDKDVLALYRTRNTNKTKIEISVSVDGIVKMVFLESKFPLIFRDDWDAVKVNYVYANNNYVNDYVNVNNSMREYDNKIHQNHLPTESVSTTTIKVDLEENILTNSSTQSLTESNNLNNSISEYENKNHEKHMPAESVNANNIKVDEEINLTNSSTQNLTKSIAPTNHSTKIKCSKFVTYVVIILFTLMNASSH